MWRTIGAGLRTMFRREAADRDLNDEVRHYLEMAADEHRRAGLSDDDAARAARVAMGSIAATKERVRSGGWEARVETIWRDVRYAVRGLRRNPGFATIAILTLALGTGANTLMFSVVNAVMLRPLPYHDSHRLAFLWTDDVRRGLHREATPYATIGDWSARSRSWSGLAYFSTQRVAPMSNNPPGRGRTRSALVSANLFDVLGVQPLLGRGLTRADEIDRAPVAVISYGFWQRWLGGAPDVLGTPLTIEDPSKGGTGALTIVGVMPADFYFPDKLTDLWTPATTYWRFGRESSERFPSWARRWTAVARLAPGVSMTAARADMTRVGSELTSLHPASVADFPGFATTVVPALDTIAGTNLQSALWILFGATTVVLLVACANVANLLLARGAARQHEFAVRRALGGGRGRLLRQLAIEHLVLALAGGSAGLAIAAWGLGILRTVAAAAVPRMDEMSVDVRVLAAATAAAVAAAVVFGAEPALRLSAADASEALKESGRASGSRRVRRARGLMVLAECALAIVLLAGAGLLLKSLARVLAIEPGFDPRGVLTMRLEFPSEPPPTAEERRQTSAIAPARARTRERALHELLDRLRAVPGVTAASVVDDLFVSGQGNDSITIPSRLTESPAGELNAGMVTSDFFASLHVPLRRGRYLSGDDGMQKIRALWSPVVTNMSLADKERLAVPEPVVVNEAFVHRFFPGEEPIGKRFCIDPANKTYWFEVVGVVGNMHRQGLERATIPEYFGPYFPAPNGRADLLVRAGTEPLRLAAVVRQEVARAFPGVVVAQVSTADAELAGFSAQRRLQTSLLVAFGLLALALAAVGIFGLVHYMVAERTREIGVRMALGATRSDIRRLVLAHGLRMPAAGIAIGLLASTIVTRTVAHLLFDVTPIDPGTFASVAGLLAVVAAGACILAARATTRVDPSQSLRQS